MPRVEARDRAAVLLGLLLQESSQLREGPGVQSAAGLPAALLHARTDMRQVLHDNHGVRFYGVHDAAAQNVAAVAPEAVDLPDKACPLPISER